MSATTETSPDFEEGTKPVTQAAFRSAMSSFAGAVNIVTTDGAHGRAGFTATAVCAVTDSPPTLLVCVNRSSSAAPAFLGNTALCVNTVGPTHHRLATDFGGKTAMEERFAGGEWFAGQTGSPVLAGAVASFDCQIKKRLVIGTHEVLFCEIVNIVEQSGTQASVWFRRQFHELAVLSPVKQPARSP